MKKILIDYYNRLLCFFGKHKFIIRAWSLHEHKRHGVCICGNCSYNIWVKDEAGSKLKMFQVTTEMETRKVLVEKFKKKVLSTKAMRIIVLTNLYETEGIHNVTIE